jgi:hypothetical protein
VVAVSLDHEGGNRFHIASKDIASPDGNRSCHTLYDPQLSDDANS